MKPKQNKAGNETAALKIDACQTPGYAAAPLLPYLKPDSIVWEPAAGMGFLADYLAQYVGKVIRSDILTGQNFFAYSPAEPWQLLITNPPYTIKYKWIARCYELGRPFALLMPVETIAAAKAQWHFIRHGLEVIFLSRRVNFHMPNIGWNGSAAQFPVAWFTWGLNIGQQITFAEIDTIRPPASQLELL